MSEVKAKRPARRRGRWTYNNEDTLYGVAGWHLDDSPLVIDFMPGNHQCCNGGRGCCSGCYLLYNWPRRDHEPVAMYVDCAMEAIEEEWDALDDTARAEITEMHRARLERDRAPDPSCTVVAIAGGTTYPCRGHEGGVHHFAADLPDPCPAPFCRLPNGHRSLHDVPSGKAEYRDASKEPSRA